jgi:hypothetical protein
MEASAVRTGKEQKSSFNPVDKTGVKIPSSIYFGGCAWGSAFYVGVYKAMNEVSFHKIYLFYYYTLIIIIMFVIALYKKYGVCRRDGQGFRIRYWSPETQRGAYLQLPLRTD